MGDVQTRHEAQGTPWPYRCWQIFQRIGQGTQVHSDQGRISPRLLAEAQLPQAPPEELILNLKGKRAGQAIMEWHHLFAVTSSIAIQLASSIRLGFLCVIPDLIKLK